MFSFTDKHDAFNNTVLVLLGDHGFRLNGYKYTAFGQIEERSAFYALHLPTWFSQHYPHVHAALLHNTQYSVSNWDLHRTLLDLVQKGRLDVSA